MITYGATRAKLIENGFFACSAMRPDAKHNHALSEDIGAIKCISPRSFPAPSTNVVAVIITAVNKKRHLAVLAKHGLAAGPCRTDSAGNLTYVLRYDEYSPILSRQSEKLDGEAEAAVILDSGSGIIRLDGTWSNGDLLSTPRSDLPAIDNAGIEALFEELKAAFPTKPWVDPYVPADQRPVNLREIHAPKMSGVRCKRDVASNFNVIEALKASGKWDELPEFPPDDVDPPARRADPGRTRTARHGIMFIPA
jgi:hypothetical protein